MMRLASEVSSARVGVGAGNLLGARRIGHCPEGPIVCNHLVAFRGGGVGRRPGGSVIRLAIRILR